MRRIAVLGATGSIGTQTLDIIRQHPESFKACALAAGTRSDELFALAREFKPECCALVKETQIPDDLKHIEWYFGTDCAERMVRETKADDALCAVVGIAGLGAVLAALDSCERVLLANKEALVTGGTLVTEKARRLGKLLLPVDSEHSAIFQCLQAANGNEPRRLILTCSGGALRNLTKAEIDNATVTDVLKHPTWRMGSKITVDCASLMNKGLEVIEAHHLFKMPLERIKVVIHPQSVIHSLVEFEDNALLAQLGQPDMRGPIGYAMGYPERVPFGGKPLDLETLSALTFEAPDTERFPCLAYAIEAQKRGGSMPVTLNGANEAAVASFLKGEIKFSMIAETVHAALDNFYAERVESVEEVYEYDTQAREYAQNYIKKYGDK